MILFWEKIDEIEQFLKSLSEPSKSNTKALLNIIGNDETIATYFYDKLAKGYWVDFLKKANEFKDLAGIEKELSNLSRMKIYYLADAAKEKPAEVLEIIQTTPAMNDFVQGKFIEALFNMPAEKAVTATKTICGYIEDREWLNWYQKGEPAAKLMVKLAGTYNDEAFAIAEKLLELWVPESKGDTFSEDVVGKCQTFEYEELVSEFFSKLCEINPARAMKLLIDTLERYLKEYAKGKDYEPSELYYIRIKQVDDEAASLGRHYISIIVKAICDAGRVVLEKQPENVDEIFDLLEKLNRQIFMRIEMYLLSFIADGSQNERINRFIGDLKIIEHRGCRYEYRKLLNDRFDDVSDEAKTVFENWVDGQNIENLEEWNGWFKRTRDREPTEEDRKKYIAGIKARELYLVKGQYNELYKKYLAESGFKEEEIKPISMDGEARFVDPAEGSRISAEEFGELSAAEAIEAVNNPVNWENKKNQHYFYSAKHSLAAAFKTDFKRRIGEYFTLDDNKILSLDVMFLDDVFDVVWSGLREAKLEEKYLNKLLRLMGITVALHSKDKAYKHCFLSITRVIGAVFDDEKLRDTNLQENINKYWDIIEPLVKYEYSSDEHPSEVEKNVKLLNEGTNIKEDPVQKRIMDVNAQAFELVIRLGVICKNQKDVYCNEKFKIPIEAILNYVNKEIKRPEVVSVFGSWLGQLLYINKEWFTNNIDTLFNPKDELMWDAIWGTFVTWGRTSENLFKLLCPEI